MLIEIIKVLVLGIVEGITEWLPISSTGHMILVNEFIKLNVSEEFFSMFEVVIQLGAILAVVVLYFKKLCPFGFNKTKQEIKDTWNLWFKVIVSCLPAAVIGLVADDWLDEHLYNSIVVSLMLIIYGVLFIVVENYNKKRKPSVKELAKITYKQALLVGIFQVLALIPGTSRSGATILGGLLIGLDRAVATEFTFFLAIPVMFGASLLKILKFGFAFTSTELIILVVGMISAFVVSIIAIKFLMKFIKKNDFKPFGYYRIVLGILVLLFFLIFK